LEASLAVALTEIPKNDRSDEQGYLERHYEAVYLRRREINERHHERSLDSALVAASAADDEPAPEAPASEPLPEPVPERHRTIRDVAEIIAPKRRYRRSR
jgi:hypothetical protein